MKPASGTAGAQIVPAELLHQFLVAVHYAQAALDASLGRVAFPSLAGALKSSAVRRGVRGALPYSLLVRDWPPGAASGTRYCRKAKMGMSKQLHPSGSSPVTRVLLAGLRPTPVVWIRLRPPPRSRLAVAQADQSRPPIAEPTMADRPFTTRAQTALSLANAAAARLGDVHSNFIYLERIPQKSRDFP